MICAYVCKMCGGRVVPQMLGHEPGRHEVSWCCTNPDCKQCYGPPWRENDREYPMSAMLDIGLKPWPQEDAVNPGCAPLPSITSLMDCRPTMADVRRFLVVVLQGTTIGTVSAISMLFVLWLLLMSL